MNQRDSYHMTPEEYRTRGREVVDWIASYMKGGRLPRSFESIVDDLDEIILPDVTHWQKTVDLPTQAVNN